MRKKAGSLKCHFRSIDTQTPGIGFVGFAFAGFLVDFFVLAFVFFADSTDSDGFFSAGFPVVFFFLDAAPEALSRTSALDPSDAFETAGALSGNEPVWLT